MVSKSPQTLFCLSTEAKHPVHQPERRPDHGWIRGVGEELVGAQAGLLTRPLQTGGAGPGDPVSRRKSTNPDV